MTESEFEEPEQQKPTFVRRILTAWQWLFAAVIALIALALALNTGRLSAPGAPVIGYWASVLVFVLIVIALAPPLFFRLSQMGQRLSYFAILPAIIFSGVMGGQAEEAYERTPEGAIAAKQNAIDEAKAAKAREAEAETEELLAAAKAESAKLEEVLEQQNDCLSWGGELTELNRLVRDSLHNPNSFEHDETEFIVPRADRHNVLLTFRAENGFGATRAGQVTAQMNPETCDIINVGELQPL